MQGEASSDGVLNDEPHHAAVCRKVGKVFFSVAIEIEMWEFNSMPK